MGFVRPGHILHQKDDIPCLDALPNYLRVVFSAIFNPLHSKNSMRNINPVTTEKMENFH